MARLLVGEMAEELLLNGQRVAPAALQAAGFSFEYPELFDRENPDILLTDVDMPIMGGLQLLDQLRSRRACLPAVVVSGRGDPREGRDLSYQFLAKPIDLVELQEKIQLALAS